MFDHYSTQPLAIFVRNHLLTAAACVFGTLSPVLAEGTKELLSDGGLYAGNPPASIRMDIYIWSANNQTSVVDALYEATDAPEGRQVAKTTIDTQWGGWGIFNVLAYDRTKTTPLDCSDYQGGALRFWLKSEHELLVEIEYLLHDAPAFHGKVRQTVPSTGGRWTEIVIPLSELPTYPEVGGGLDLSQIIGPFLISTSLATGGTSEAKTWYVDHVRWTKPVASLAVFPSHTRVNPDRHRLFVVEPRSASGEAIFANVAFTTPPTVGTLLPAGPVVAMGSVLTAGQTSGNVTATFTDSSTSLSESATVQVTGDDLKAQFGIVSDTRTNLDLSTNSKLLTFYGGSLTPAVIVTNESFDVKEGGSSVRTKVYGTSTNSYSGWTVIWGTNSSLETETKDMSEFYDGSLRFWLKAPPGLQGKLTIGIRSGNVISGKELSKVSLDDYFIDGSWHAVSLPLKAFAGPRPWADISRVRCFFTIAVVGTTPGPQELLVDDVRWDTETPTPTNVLQFVSFGQSAQGFQLSLEGPAAMPFTIEDSTDLAHWSPVYSNVLVSGQFTYQHTNALSSARLFYRAVGTR
jgi:hypothetical protein